LQKVLKNFDNELGQKNEKDGGKVPKEILLEIFGRIYQVFAYTESWILKEMFWQSCSR